MFLIHSTHLTSSDTMVMVIYMVYGMVTSDTGMSKIADRRFVFEGSSGLKRETVILFLISW